MKQQKYSAWPRPEEEGRSEFNMSDADADADADACMPRKRSGQTRVGVQAATHNIKKRDATAATYTASTHARTRRPRRQWYT